MSDDISDKDAEKLNKFKLDLTSDANVNLQPRLNAHEDMRFINIPGAMWQDFFEQDRERRVRLELDIVSNHLQRFIGGWNQNRVGVEYKPNDAGTTKEDSDLLNGIYRSDFRQSGGKLATDNAVDEAATVGYGAMKLATVFEDEGDPENDNQNIEWRPIYNAYNTVIWDQSAKRIDKADAKYVTELTQFTTDSFDREFEGFKPVSVFVPDMRFFDNSFHQEIDLIFVGTRYEIEENKTIIHVYNDFNNDKVITFTDEDHEKVKDELKKDDTRVFVRTREITVPTVHKTVFSGSDILRNTRRIAGRMIPIVPFYAYRSFVDGIEYYKGLVRPLKDSQRIFNMQVSQLAENAASAGQEVPIFDPSQMLGEDIQEGWADKNNVSYLLANALRDKAGNIVVNGPIGYSKPGQLDASTTTLLQIVPQHVREYTGVHPSEAVAKEMSGKALAQIMKRENLNTQVISDNIANAIARSGEIYQAIASEIYTTRRIVKTISRDGTESETQINETIVDEDTGKLIEGNSLAGKKFQSYSDIGPQYETLREQTVEDLKGMLLALGDSPEDQQLRRLIMNIMLENITGVGLAPIKEFNRNQMLAQGFIKPETPEEEALVQQAQQPKEDPNAKLIEAASQQLLAEGRSLDSSSIQKIADAGLKEAKTVETLTGIGQDQQKIDNETRKQANQEEMETLKIVRSLPVDST